MSARHVCRNVFFRILTFYPFFDENAPKCSLFTCLIKNNYYDENGLFDEAQKHPFILYN